MKDPQEVLRGPFDPETHRETFVHYFEAVALPDGSIEYAVPSHQMKLEALAREMGIDPRDACPKERVWDYFEWLLEVTGAVCLWEYKYEGEPNAKQRQAIRRLCAEGLMQL